MNINKLKPTPVTLLWLAASSVKSQLTRFGTYHSYGLCANISGEMTFTEGYEACYSQAMDLMKYLMQEEWEYSTGIEDYPVPSMDDLFTSKAAYRETPLGLMYKGEYGALRLDLLDFIIMWCEERL